MKPLERAAIATLRDPDDETIEAVVHASKFTDREISPEVAEYLIGAAAAFAIGGQEALSEHEHKWLGGKKDG